MQRFRGVDVRVAYDVFQMPLHGVYPVLVVEQMFDAPRRVGVGYRMVHVVVIVIVRYRTFEYFVRLFRKHDKGFMICGCIAVCEADRIQS